MPLPLGLGVLALVFRQVPQLAALLGPAPAAVTTWGFYRDALLLSTALFFGVAAARPARGGHRAAAAARCSSSPDRDYRLYGVHYWAHRRSRG